VSHDFRYALTCLGVFLQTSRKTVILSGARYGLIV
jgi:hypothetical protein